MSDRLDAFKLPTSITQISNAALRTTGPASNNVIPNPKGHYNKRTGRRPRRWLRGPASAITANWPRGQVQGLRRSVREGF